MVGIAFRPRDLLGISAQCARVQPLSRFRLRSSGIQEQVWREGRHHMKPKSSSETNADQTLPGLRRLRRRVKQLWPVWKSVPFERLTRPYVRSDSYKPDMNSEKNELNLIMIQWIVNDNLRAILSSGGVSPTAPFLSSRGGRVDQSKEAGKLAAIQQRFPHWRVSNGGVK